MYLKSTTKSSGWTHTKKLFPLPSIYGGKGLLHIHTEYTSLHPLPELHCLRVGGEYPSLRHLLVTVLVPWLWLQSLLQDIHPWILALSSEVIMQHRLCLPCFDLTHSSSINPPRENWRQQSHSAFLLAVFPPIHRLAYWSNTILWKLAVIATYGFHFIYPKVGVRIWVKEEEKYHVMQEVSI